MSTPVVFDKADTAFVFANAALVMIMTPGLALFYGGMVRQKNVVSTLMQSFISLIFISLQWYVVV
jgi:Amt family ammonium transporter